MKTFIPDGRYKKSEIEKALGSNASHGSRGYYRVNGTAIIYTNLNITSTNIGGKIFDYKNFKNEDGTLIWEAATGENENTNLLRRMCTSEIKTHVFYRDEKKDRTDAIWKYYGEVLKFQLLTPPGSSTASFQLHFSRQTITSQDQKLNNLFEPDNFTGLKGEFFVKENISKIIREYAREFNVKLTETEDEILKDVIWWYPRDKRKNRDFDFRNSYIEVKTNTTTKESGFRLSENEYNLLLKTIENNGTYALVLIWNIDSQPEYKLYFNNDIPKFFQFEEKRLFYARKRKD